MVGESSVNKLALRSGDGELQPSQNERFRNRIRRHSNTNRIQSSRQPVGHMRLFLGSTNDSTALAKTSEPACRRSRATRVPILVPSRWNSRERSAGSTAAVPSRRRLYRSPPRRAHWPRAHKRFRLEKPPVRPRVSIQRHGQLHYSGKSSFASPAILPVCLKTRNACIIRSRSPSKTRSTSPMESLVR